MRKFRLDKLVRNGIVDQMLRAGQKPDFRTVKGEELLRYSQAKLVEEAGEFDPTSPKALEELGDLREIIDNLARQLGSTSDEVKKIQGEKQKKMGDFSEGIVIDTLVLADDDPWANYYAAEPERFPELPTS